MQNKICHSFTTMCLRSTCTHWPQFVSPTILNMHTHGPNSVFRPLGEGLACFRANSKWLEGLSMQNKICHSFTTMCLRSTCTHWPQFVSPTILNMHTHGPNSVFRPLGETVPCWEKGLACFRANSKWLEGLSMQNEICHSFTTMCLISTCTHRAQFVSPTTLNMVNCLQTVFRPLGNTVP